MQGKQVFEASSSSRWQRVKWSSRLFMFFVLLAIAVILITFIRAYQPAIPRIKQRSLDTKKALIDKQGIVYKNSELARKYEGFRKYIDDRDLRREPYITSPSQSFSPRQLPASFPTGIRSAFYVAWDPQSFFSLQRNINKLNLVIPEWMFIRPGADTLYTNVDARAFAVMKQARVNVMPILSNFYDSTFHGEAVHRIITNPVKRKRLIDDVLHILQKNNFLGVNVDFEELQESSDEAFVSFQKELYERLHAAGFLVSQDMVPFNEDYNYKELSKYNDYVFVMAYDQFTPDTKPGPIAEQKWIEGAINEAVKHIPPSKIILSLAQYGYDWPLESSSANLTYQQALVTAKESEGKIEYDNDTYNLHYTYYDDDNIEHSVFFTDAATAFNSMRFAVESNLGGVAIWRLGSEDSRIWSFYNLDMRKTALQQFDFAAFAKVESSDDVDYLGQGEVLDVKAVPTNGRITTQLDSSEFLISEESYDELPSMFVVNAYGWNGVDTARNRKKLVLTFDDGPDPEWTKRVLDILAENHVPATFFVVGQNAEENIPLIKRMYREGHEIGNHTFTHPNIATVSRQRAIIEMEATRSLIECITGHSTILFRAPYNADFQPETYEELQPVAIAREKNYLDVGESIDPLDWEPGVTADSIFQRVVSRKQELNDADLAGSIILLHDAGGDTREETVKALPRIIDYFRNKGYTFTTVADLINKKKEDLMPPVPPGSGYFILQALYVVAEMSYWAGHILFALFLIFIILSIFRISLFAFMAMREKTKEKESLIASLPANCPLVSIIVPAYNEELNAVSSLQNLLKTTYPNYNIIFVDDGSRDATYGNVSTVFEGHAKIKVFTKPNGGKASALNFGLQKTNAEFVVCIDADTKLHPDAVSQLMKHLTPGPAPSIPQGNASPSPSQGGVLPSGKGQLCNETVLGSGSLQSEALCVMPSLSSSAGEGRGEVGAVAGNVKVGNEVNMLTKWQAIEYISSQNFDRRAFALVNAITVVPGAIGAFRKQAIEEAGGFTTDTLAEDCDLTIRILRAGYLVKNEIAALAFTEAPEKIKQFTKQRFRWSFGVLQTFWKHKDILFNSKYGWLGWLAMPNILLFQYIIPFFIPVADFFMLIGLLTGNAGKILPYYIAFMLFDAAIAIIAFRMERERLSRLIWLIPQRLIYRWIMWWVLFKAVRRAIKGELQSWGVLKRTGRVKEVVS